MADRQGFEPLNLTDFILTIPAYIKRNKQIKHTSFTKNRAFERKNAV